MSHHYSGPDFGFPRGDARLDLTDLYAFPKPGDPRKSILIINVHPSAVLNPPGPTTADPFALEAMRFKFCNPTASLYNNRTQLHAALEFACLDIIG